MTSQILNRQTLAASCLQEKHARKYLLKSQTSHLDRPDRPSWLDSQTLEPDILECEVKWALGSITMNKASRSDVIPVELFQILKEDAGKVLHSICQKIWKTQQLPQDWKRSIFIPIPKKGNAKECSNYCTISLISHASEVMLKILQARLQQYVKHELDLEKAEEPEIKLPTSIGSLKRQESSIKTSSSALLTMSKHLTVWITKAMENSSREGNTRPSHLPPEKPICRLRSKS